VALDTDLLWKHTHTRLLLRAREWESHSEEASFLLRGAALKEAEQWSRLNELDPNSLVAGQHDAESGESSAASQMTHTKRDLGIVGEFLDASIQHREDTSKATIEADHALGWVQRDVTTAERIRTLFAVASPASALFACGQIERLYGKSAPYPILLMLVLALILGAVHLEARSRFGDGNTFAVVNSSLGPGFAVFSQYAILFDSLLLGGIMLASAASYFRFAGAMLFSSSEHTFWNSRYIEGILVIALAVLLWAKRILKVKIPTPRRSTLFIPIMSLVCAGWGIVTCYQHPTYLPPYNGVARLSVLGWLRGIALPGRSWIVLLIPIATSMLVLSNEDAVLHHVSSPLPPGVGTRRWKVAASEAVRFILPASVPFFYIMIIPDSLRVEAYADVPIPGLLMNMIGPFVLRKIMSIIIAGMGTYSLLAAYDAGILRPDGVLWKAARRGIQTTYLQTISSKPWFNNAPTLIVAALQLAVIVTARSNIHYMVDAYGFGIGAGLSLKVLGLIVGRYQGRSPREWRLPLNLTVASREIPIGLILVATALCLLTCISLLSRKLTVFGFLFASVLFVAHHLRRDRGTPAPDPSVQL
jgi:hypothetical protein